LASILTVTTEDKVKKHMPSRWKEEREELGMICPVPFEATEKQGGKNRKISGQLM